MQVFFFVHAGGGTLLAFFDGAFAADGDFGATVGFELFEGVAAGADEEADKVDFGEFAGGDVDLQ